ncbi:MAG: hypothetical protein ACOCPS_06120 [Desulfonatronovibrio sp.]
MNYLNRLLIILLVFGIAGCGKKVWPEPDASQEKFSISETSGQIKDNCAVIKSEISGNHRNLGRIILELEISDDHCPACPFLVTDSVFMAPGSRSVTIEEKSLTITHCGLDPDRYYRARLRAGNIYPMIREVTSGVINISQ